MPTLGLSASKTFIQFFGHDADYISLEYSLFFKHLSI